MFVWNLCLMTFIYYKRFKRLTGRNEAAISARDYKFYSPRHKYRRISSNSISSISGLSVRSYMFITRILIAWIHSCSKTLASSAAFFQTFPGTDSSSIVTAQGYRSVNEVRLLTVFNFRK